MKTFAFASVIALASVASAQLDAIPSCALSCFVGPLGSDGCAALTDFKCHCQKGAELVAKVTPCVQGACSASDQAATVAAVQKTCQDAGVPLQVSVPVSGASSAAPVSSAASAASSAAASVASSAAGAASSAVSSAAGAISSAASRASSATASATGNASASARPSSSPSQFTGGAPQATAVGLLGAAAIAMLAL